MTILNGGRYKKKFQHRYSEEIKKRIQKSCVHPDKVALTLNDIIRDCIHETFADCPIGADWLIEKGFSNGRLLGDALKELKKYWGDHPNISRESMIEHAENYAKEALSSP